MRCIHLLMMLSLVGGGCASTQLTRNVARKQISQVGSSNLVPDAIEVRNITTQGSDQAIAETTVTLAFQFTKDKKTGEWSIESVRLGDRDWVSLKELLTAINGGSPPDSTASQMVPTIPDTPSRTEVFHVNDSDFERQRQRILELGSSRLVPDAIEIRRVASGSDTRTIAEATVTLRFQFRKNVRSGAWAVESVRLGERDWINLNDLVGAMHQGRRLETSVLLQKLVIGIDNYKKKNGSLPNARDIVQLTDVLHPSYMTDLVRNDAWGRPIEYESSGSTFRLISSGPDGRRGTDDDVVVDASSTPTP